MQTQSFKLEEIQIKKTSEKYDYFLESVVCLLFGCSEFQKSFSQSIQEHHNCYPNCIPCTLANVYNSVMTSKYLDVTNLKLRLSSLYKGKNIFQSNQPTDAMECLNAILNAFHCKKIGDKSDGLNEESLDQDCESTCVAHSLFSLGVLENYTCECRNKFQTEWDYSNYCQYFNIAEILVQANFDYSNDLLTVPLFKLKNYKNESNSKLYKSMMLNLNKKLSNAEANICDKENCTKKKSKIVFSLQNPPSIYIMNIIWESDDAGHLDSFISTISITESITMKNIYGNSTDDPYNLRGILFFGRNHYEYALRTEDFWAFKGLGEECGWLELLKEITIMNYHPVCLVYEKSQQKYQFSIEKSELLEIEKLACECDHYENKVHEEYYNELTNDCSGLFNDRKSKNPSKEIVQNNQGRLTNNVIESEPKSIISIAVNKRNTIKSKAKEDREIIITKNSRYDKALYEESSMSYASQSSEKSPDTMSNPEGKNISLKNKTWKCSCGSENSETWDVCIKCQSLKPGLEGWVCKICTTINPNMKLKCESCFSARDTITKNQEDYWVCNSCNSFNPGSRNLCSQCRKKKPEQENIISKLPEVESKKVESNFDWVCKKCSNGNNNYSVNCAFCRASKPIEEDKSDGWTCEKCKTKNQMASKYCDKCYEYKPVIKDPPPDQNASWKCSKCSTNNSAISVKCSLCLAVKTQVSNNWVCANCSKLNPNTITICGTCKARKDAPKNQCSQCGVQIELTKIMCDNCSHPAISEVWTCKLCSIQNTTEICRRCSYNKSIAAAKISDQKVVQPRPPSIICITCKNPATILICPGCTKPTNLGNACMNCGKSLASANICSNCEPRVQTTPAKAIEKTKKCKNCRSDNKLPAQRCFKCKRAL
ncbi:hypothetical protein SteCoe_11762 [Stentor coeruleus]|uniref:RanBP2-type domain-containing protein n=1 Tax=Stentor coeruleus TaxID=5963 RepID=A0A1R2CCE7_9CILI|nr:hypothetical protein SteCoe_11762 [Stentor coeruleus]